MFIRVSKKFAVQRLSCPLYAGIRIPAQGGDDVRVFFALVIPANAGIQEGFDVDYPHKAGNDEGRRSRR
jgi:hypothetical protein